MLILSMIYLNHTFHNVGVRSFARYSFVLVCVFVHVLILALIILPWFGYREVAKGLAKYQPDVIVSVHPLMQHIPLRVLRARGLLDKIPFTTVITDLSTCHPTW